MWHWFDSELLGQDRLYAGLFADQILELGGVSPPRHKVHLVPGGNGDAEGHDYLGVGTGFENDQGSLDEGANH